MKWLANFKIDMKKRTCGIALEGLPAIILCAFLSLLSAILGSFILTLLFLILTLFVSFFFRDPERFAPFEKDQIMLSPADGKIVAIARKKNPCMNDKQWCISIFMSLFNVHINRMPLYGKIKEISYHEGKFLNASFNKASEINERCTYVVENSEVKFTMVQIAGLVARRIISFVNIGDEMKKGDRFGMIMFGSRVEIYLPENYKPCVKIGEKVIAGESIIGINDIHRNCIK